MGYKEELKKKILELKKKKNAVILGHNYQRPEIQEIADYTGDSLGLCRMAQKLDRDLIVFCGVTFMAESAKILNPQKKVIIPEIDATCPMADMATPENVLKFKKENNCDLIVTYVNTYADVKAISDICCTSGNAIKVVESLPQSKRILFVPDMNLGAYVKRVTKRDIVLYPGYCHVHKNRILLEDLLKVKKEYPDAIVLAHPECNKEILDEACEVLSTSGMLEYVEKSQAEQFIICTEKGMEYPLKKIAPNKMFIFPSLTIVCPTMKLISFQSLYDALFEEKYEITLDQQLIEKAYEPLKKMVEIF